MGSKLCAGKLEMTRLIFDRSENLLKEVWVQVVGSKNPIATEFFAEIYSKPLIFSRFRLSFLEGRFIENKTLIFNRENIEIYYINLDVFSIGNQCFAFNEQGSGTDKGSTVYNLCRLQPDPFCKR